MVAWQNACWAAGCEFGGARLSAGSARSMASGMGRHCGWDQPNSGSLVLAVKLVEEGLGIRVWQMDAAHDALALQDKPSLQPLWDLVRISNRTGHRSLSPGLGRATDHGDIHNLSGGSAESPGIVAILSAKARPIPRHSADPVDLAA